MRRGFLAAIFAGLSALAVTAPAGATADGPDFWRVWDVASNDVLNYRAGPATSFPRLGHVAHNADRIKVIVCVPTTTRDQWFSISEALQQQLTAMPAWCLISRHGEQLGWVNRRYLTEDDE
ncbi:MAG: hypothetical protein R3D45_00725 [Rhizobiaceae bacterium]